MPGWILTLCLDYIIKDPVRQLSFIIRSITVFIYFMDIIHFYGETDNQIYFLRQVSSIIRSIGAFLLLEWWDILSKFLVENQREK